MTLTAAQARALEWLPSDGAWRTLAADLLASIGALRLSHPDLLEGMWNEREYHMTGDVSLVYRLTPAGIAFKAAWETGR